MRGDSAARVLAGFRIREEVRIAAGGNRFTGALAARPQDSVVLRRSTGDQAIAVASIDTIWRGMFDTKGAAKTGRIIGATGLGFFSAYVARELRGNEEHVLGLGVLGAGVGALLGGGVGAAIGSARVHWQLAFRRTHP